MGADTAKGNVLHFMLHTAANVHVFSQNGLIFGGRWPGWPSLEVTKLCMLREIKVKRLWMQTHTHTRSIRALLFVMLELHISCN